MQLDELEKRSKPVHISNFKTSRTIFDDSQEEIRIRREDFTRERCREDRAIAQGVCPDCGHPVVKEPSKYYTKSVSYYMCQNPDKSLGHVFIRS